MSTSTTILGINYSNLGMPDSSFGEPSQHPYIAIRSVDIFDGLNGGAGSMENHDDGRSPVDGGLQRLVVNVNPHPETQSTSTLLNLDTNQLYAPCSSSEKGGYNYGQAQVGSYGGTQYCPTKSKSGGVYTNPAPILGAPVEFKKIYFRGKLADSTEGYITDEQTRAFSAVFACSDPIESTTISDEDNACGNGLPSGTMFNPRDENAQYDESISTVRKWEDVEIFGGGGCATSFSSISGYSYYENKVTGYTASGCDTLIFTGCSGVVADINTNTVTICYTGCDAHITGIESDDGFHEVSECDQIGIKGCGEPNESANLGIQTLIDDGDISICITGDGLSFQASSSNCSASSTNPLTVTNEDGVVTYNIDVEDVFDCFGLAESTVRYIGWDATDLSTGRCSGIFLVRELSCDGDTPPEEEGYCCISDEGGSQQTESDCTALGGFYWGDDSDGADVARTHGNAYPDDTSLLLSDLCTTVTCCFYDYIEEEYVCETNKTLKYYYDTIFATTSYEWDENNDDRYAEEPRDSTPIAGSEYHVSPSNCGNCPADPTATSTTTTTSTTTAF